MTASKNEHAVLIMLKKVGKPVSTREIALHINKSWHTVLTACLRLQLQNKIEGVKVGNVHVWEAIK